MITLSKTQLQNSIQDLLEQNNGLNELMQLLLNGLMKAERKHLLSDTRDIGNKGNGYRYGKAFGHGKILELKIPSI